jgi:formyltetrahydrofolate deformylase
MATDSIPAEPAPTVRFLLSGPNRRGLVAGVADFIYQRGGDVVHADQHTDVEANVFLQRVEWTPVPGTSRSDLGAEAEEMAANLGMRLQARWSDEDRPFAILVSARPHCLYDLLARSHSGELPGRLALVVSNHPDHASVTESFGVPYHYLPVDPGDPADQEAGVEELLAASGVELVVLARYMRILSGRFVDRWAQKVINIHHSFLPAFVGARPYHRAHERGVKLIGATAHYATADLDQGPIIEQDVARVSHRDDVPSLIHAGRDLETVVLARAVRWHLTDRVLVYGNRTVVFA